MRSFVQDGRQIINKVRETTVMSDAPTQGRVIHERHEHILKIIIDNPAKKNAFSPDMMPKFFGPAATAKPHPEGNVDPFGLGKQCRKPIVTAVQGIVYTVGIELMLAGDIVVAADDCRFCQMEAKRGIAPLGGAHFRYIARSGWGNAMYHLLLCDEFSSAEAYRVGLVQEVVPAGQQVERAMALAGIIARNAPLGIQVTKESARTYIAAGEQAAIAYVPQIRERVLNSADAAEGIKSFVERRAARFTGS